MAHLNLLPTSPNFSDAEMSKAYETDLAQEHKERDFLRAERLEDAAIESAGHDASRTAGGLGKMVLNVPLAEYHDLEAKYPGCWNDRAFIRDYQKRIAGAKVANV